MGGGEWGDKVMKEEQHRKEFLSRLMGLLIGYLKLVYKNIDNLRAIKLNVKTTTTTLTCCSGTLTTY